MEAQYPGHYQVYNVSERSYPASKFPTGNDTTAIPTTLTTTAIPTTTTTTAIPATTTMTAAPGNGVHCSPEGSKKVIDPALNFELWCKGGIWVPHVLHQTCKRNLFNHDGLCQAWVSHCKDPNGKEWMERFCEKTCFCAHNQNDHCCTNMITTTEYPTTETETETETIP